MTGQATAGDVSAAASGDKALSATKAAFSLVGTEPEVLLLDAFVALAFIVEVEGAVAHAQDLVRRYATLLHGHKVCLTLTFDNSPGCMLILQIFLLDTQVLFHIVIFDVPFCILILFVTLAVLLL